MMKPRILFLPDKPGWIYETRALILSKILGDKYDFDIKYMCDLKKFDHNLYDIVFLFYWRHLDKLDFVPKRKIISNVASFKSFWGVPDDERKNLLNRASYLLPICNGLFDMVKDLHPNVFVAPNGTDINVYKPTWKRPSDKLIVGWAGSLKHDYLKGATEFVKPATKKANVELKLVTNLPREEMVDFYNSIDVYICASFTEGAPNTALEAGACGKAIISTEVGIIGDFIKHKYSGYIVDRDLDSFVDAIKFCDNNRDLVQLFGRRIREETENNWSWETRSKIYDETFQRVLSDG